MESCGVLLSVVLTGPTSSFKEDNDDGNVEEKKNDREKRRNNITNVYIECKRISSSSHRHQGNARGQKQPIDRTIVYNEEDESFSC